VNPNEWPSEWLRGVLEVAVLHALLDGPSYGYAIAGRLADAGFGEIKGGTLYPLLTRLESAGAVTIEWRACDGGPGRKYYALTPDGSDRARALADQWTRFAHVTTAFIHPQEN